MSAATLELSDKEVLERAAEIKESKDHAQMHLGDGTTSVCMIASIYMALGMKPENFSTYYGPGFEEARTIRRRGNDLNDKYWQGGVCGFNNSHSKEECVTEFRRVAATAV